MRIILYAAVFFLLFAFLPLDIVHGNQILPVSHNLQNDLKQDVGLNFPKQIIADHPLSWGYGIAMDKEDESIYTVGIYEMLHRKFLLIKWDKDGNELWHRNPHTKESRGDGVAIDNNRSIYTVGNIYSHSIFGKITSEYSVFTKWNLTGQQIFSRTWNGSTHKVTADKNGSIYTIGRGNTNFLLIKWDSEGSQLWNRSGAYGSGHAVTTDNDRKIYTIYNELMNKPSFFTPFVSLNDSLLIVWDDSGNQLWNHTYNGFIGGISVDIRGNIYLAGESLMKLDSTGDLIWNQTLPREVVNYNHFDDIVLASDGTIYTISDYRAIDYEPSANTKKAPFSSIILAKWNIIGNLLGIQLWHTREDYSEEIIMGKDGNIYCVGSYGESGPDHYLQVVIFSPTDFSSPPMPTSVTSISVLGFGYLIVIPVMCLLIYLKKKKSLMERKYNP
ncbi:MAG: PQQ-binding-like beta-propeller repeat protein [Promethearchaeota archaeon]